MKKDILVELGLMVLLLVVVITGVNLMFSQVEKDLNNCGGLAKCAGAVTKEFRDDFNSGMNTEER